MKELVKLLIGVLNPADNGAGESTVNRLLKVLGTSVIVLGALTSAINELMAMLQAGG